MVINSWAITLLRFCFEETLFLVSTDHMALRWILIRAEATGKLARWWLRFLESELDILYFAGKKHRAADALLPLKMKGENNGALDINISVFTVSFETCSCAPLTEKPGPGTTTERKDPFVFFILEFSTT